MKDIQKIIKQGGFISELPVHTIKQWSHFNNWLNLFSLGYKADKTYL